MLVARRCPQWPPILQEGCQRTFTRADLQGSRAALKVGHRRDLLEDLDVSQKVLPETLVRPHDEVPWIGRRVT